MKKIFIPFFLLFSNLTLCQSDQWFHLNNYAPNEITLDSQFLWVATNSGVIQREKETMSICNIWNRSNSAINDFPIEKITVAPNGEIWCASPKKVFKFDGDQWEKLDTTSNAGIGFSPDGMPIFGYHNFTNAPNGNYQERGTYDLKMDAQGKTWAYRTYFYCAGSGGSGVTCFTPIEHILKYENWEWQEVATSTFQFPFYNYAVSPTGNLFISGLDDILVKNTPSGSLQPINSPVKASRLYFSPDSTLWLTNQDTSIDAYSFKNGVFTKHDLFSEKDVHQFIVDENGDFFGWDENEVWKLVNGEIKRFNISDFHSFEYYSQFNVHRILSNYSEDLWVIHKDRSLSHFDGQNLTTILNPSTSDVPSNAIQKNYCDEQGNLWVILKENGIWFPSLSTRIYQVKDSWEPFDTATCGLVSYDIEDFYSDTLGNVWFLYSDTTQGFVVCRYNGSIWENFESMDSLYFSNAFPLGYSSKERVLYNKTNTNEINVIKFPDSLELFYEENAYIQISNTNIPLLLRKRKTSWLRDLYVFDGQEWNKIFTIEHYDQFTSSIFGVGNHAYYLTIPNYNSPFIAGVKPTLVALNLTDTSHTVINFDLACDPSEYKYHVLYSPGFIEHQGQLWLNYRYHQNFNPGQYRCEGYQELMKIEGDSIIERQDVGYTIFPLKNGTAYHIEDASLAILKNYSPHVSFFEKENNICEGSQITTTIIHGADNPYEINWTDGQTDFQRYLENGEHQLELVDSEGQQYDFSLVVNQPPISNEVTEYLLNNTSTISVLKSSPSGGVPPYTYLWSTGATTDTIQVLQSGNYNITITDTEGCSFVDDYNYQLVQSPNELQLSSYPNPNITDILTVEFTVIEAGDINLNLMNSQGIILQKEEEFFPAGIHEINFDISNLSGGLYSVTLQIGSVKRASKFIRVVE